MDWREEKLLYQAEQAATRCGLCREFGHWTNDCPTLTTPLLTREAGVRRRLTQETETRRIYYYCDAWECTLWRAVFVALSAFLAGGIVVELWK